MEEIQIFLEFKNYFGILFMTRKYNDMKSFFDLRYPCWDKGDYFVVVYKGIEVILYKNNDDYVSICEGRHNLFIH